MYPAIPLSPLSPLRLYSKVCAFTPPMLLDTPGWLLPHICVMFGLQSAAKTISRAYTQGTLKSTLFLVYLELLS